MTGLYQAQSGPIGWQTLIAKVSATTFALPKVTTGAASSITSTSAKVAGTVNPEGVATTYRVGYGLTTGYDAATPKQSAGSGTTPLAVSATLTGLDAGTTYHYRIVAPTSVGNAIGPDRTFQTAAPTISSVQFTGAPSTPTVTILGSNFGTIPPANPSTPLTCVPGDTSFDYGTSGLWLDDFTGGWRAGQTGDCIGLIVQAYTNTKIVYQFGADYSAYPPLSTGDGHTLTVWGISRSGTVAFS